MEATRVGRVTEGRYRVQGQCIRYTACDGSAASVLAVLHPAIEIFTLAFIKVHAKCSKGLEPPLMVDFKCNV